MIPAGNAQNVQDEHHDERRRFESAAGEADDANDPSESSR